jgi:hypothetical protein
MCCYSVLTWAHGSRVRINASGEVTPLGCKTRHTITVHHLQGDTDRQGSVTSFLQPHTPTVLCRGQWSVFCPPPPPPSPPPPAARRSECRPGPLRPQSSKHSYCIRAPRVINAAKCPYTHTCVRPLERSQDSCMQNVLPLTSTILHACHLCLEAQARFLRLTVSTSLAPRMPRVCLGAYGPMHSPPPPHLGHTCP